MVETLGKASAPSEVIQNLLDLQQESFPVQSIDLTQVVERLAEEELADETFRFLVKCSIIKRIDAIGLQLWRDRLSDDIRNIRPTDGIYGDFDKGAYLAMFRSKLAEYEIEYHKLKEATTILELALWKNKINERSQGNRRRCKKIRIEQSDHRKQCRISCGANIVIQHVLHYLL